MELKKVWFTLERFHGAMFDYEMNGQSADEVMKKRDGIFHCWGNELIWDAEASVWRERVIGVVEEETTGKVYQVIPECITFIK